MEFRLLGPLEVARDGQALALGGAKQRALLAALLLHANDVVSTERLADEVWGESPPATVAKSLQVHVSQLRKQLGDARLVTRAPGYVLEVGPAEVDAARFEALVEEARGAEPGTAARSLRDALALWRGPAYADLAYEPFLQPEIGRLEELRLTALEDRIDADMALGRHAELAGELEGLVREHPLRERLRARLMLSLYRSGRQADALAAYRAAREALVGELGIEPGRELRDLEQAILRQDPALDLPPAADPVAAAPAGVFVGRVPELAALAGALDDAVAGRGRLVLLVGEAGIGKSRLAEELARAAAARGARVLVGRCWEAGGAPAYWPWVQALRAYVRDAEPGPLRGQAGAGGAVLAQILPELRERLPDLPEPPSLDAEGARFRLFDAIAEFLRGAASSRPLVLVLDDLHAADAPSLLLLRFLARQLGAMRVLIVAACRDVDPVPGAQLTEMLAETGREPVTRRLGLGGLSRDEVAEYVDRVAADIASDALVDALHRDADGSPLFVGEMVRLLADDPSPASARLAIPPSLRDVIARRLARLPDASNEALEVAAVIGREFSLDPLAAARGVGEDDLLSALDEPMAARVVTDVPGSPGRLRFSHVLVRDTLYEGLTPARRIRLHKAIAAALERIYAPDVGPHLAELAHHALAGRELTAALDYFRRAGDRALGLSAYEEAARLYEVALEDTAAPDAPTRCRLLLSLGEARSRAGDTATAKRALLEAAAIARGAGLARELARAAAEYGGRIVYARAGDDEHVLPLLEEGIAALGDDDAGLRVRLLARLAGALRDEPSRMRRDEVSREAVELARRQENAAALAYALDGRAIAITGPDTAGECLALGGELLAVAGRLGDGERVVHAHMHRVGALLMRGDVDEAERELAAATPVAEELRQPAHLWDVGSSRAMLELAKGRLGEGEALAEDSLALGRRAQPEMAVPVHTMQRFALCELRGTLADVEPDIAELVRAYPARVVFRCALAHLDARVGRRAEAARVLDELGRDGFAGIPVDQEWLFATSLLAETAAGLASAGHAAVLYELLAPWAGVNVVDQAEGIRGSAARYLGLLAATTGEWPAARRHFEDALSSNAAMGFRPWLARTQDDYADLLRARGEADRARALAAEAAATYRDLGLR